jgi:hypothetical protein
MDFREIGLARGLDLSGSELIPVGGSYRQGKKNLHVADKAGNFLNGGETIGIS